MIFDFRWVAENHRVKQNAETRHAGPHRQLGRQALHHVPDRRHAVDALPPLPHHAGIVRSARRLIGEFFTQTDIGDARDREGRIADGLEQPAVIAAEIQIANPAALLVSQADKRSKQAPPPLTSLTGLSENGALNLLVFYAKNGKIRQ